PQIAHDVLALAPELHPVRAWTDGLGEGCAWIELGSQLIEVGDVQAGSEADRTGVRREFAENETDQGRLSRAVRADQADAIATHDPNRETVDQWSGCGACEHPIQ